MDILFYHGWSSGFTISEEGNQLGGGLLWGSKYDSQGIFPRYVGKLMKEWLGGSHLVMNSDTIVTRKIPLMAIRYK